MSECTDGLKAAANRPVLNEAMKSLNNIIGGVLTWKTIPGPLGNPAVPMMPGMMDASQKESSLGPRDREKGLVHDWEAQDQERTCSDNVAVPSVKSLAPTVLSPASCLPDHPPFRDFAQ